MKLRHRFLSVPLVLVGVLTAGCFGLRHPSLKPYARFRWDSTAVDTTKLTAEFLGVTTILLDDGTTRILFDGFVSRPSKWSLPWKISPNRKRIDAALKRAGLKSDRTPAKPVEAVFVAHSHYDHAFDSRVIADRTNATLVGSQSVLNIALSKPPFPTSRLRLIDNGDVLPYGRFKITVIASPHSPDARYVGVIGAPLELPVRYCAYKAGANFSFLVEHDGHRVLIHPSANFTPGFLKGVQADVVFLGIALLGKQSESFIHQYWNEVVRATGAKIVVPIHWDDFTLSLEAPGDSLKPMPRIADNFKRGIAFVLQMAEADGVAVRFMSAFQRVNIPDSIESHRLTSSPPR